MKIDDPVGAFGVHYAAGFWAMIATGFFADMGPGDNSINGGVFRKGSGRLLAYNIVAILVITIWSGGLNAISFWIIKRTIGVRMSVDEEKIGVDKIELNDYNEPEYVSKNAIEAGSSSQMNIFSTATIHSVSSFKKVKSLQENCSKKKEPIISTGSFSQLKDTYL